MLKRFLNIFIFVIVFFYGSINAYALTGRVNVNDSLTLRDAPSINGTVITGFYNNTELVILDVNAGSDSGCSKWYKVEYGNYVGYSCGDYIIINNEEEKSDTEDDSYIKENYSKPLSKDGSIMCYEDTGSLSIRSSVGGSSTSKKVDCGEDVNILETIETKGSTCPYWYKIERGSDQGYICGYFVNTTKLSSTAIAYYESEDNEDTIEGYKAKLTEDGFPESYHAYLLEIHARHPNWKFVSEKMSMTFFDAIVGEAVQNRNVLQGSAFNEGYRSTASHTYNLFTNSFIEAGISDPGYYNASMEAIAYYMDPRNYLNEKYIFAFETLGYSTNQDSVVASIISGQKFFESIYANTFDDGLGNASDDIVKASLEVGISAVHVASRIKQEMGVSLNTTDSRLGGAFTYNGNSYSNYFNFFNIKSKCSNCSSIYAGYAFEKSWNTPYKGIYGGASFMYDGYISLNQDTIYYEKFDVSTTNGDYTHQYMQNLAAPIQEGGIKYKGYVEGLYSYLDTEITFVIPVYDDMPEYVVRAPRLGSNNNYLNDIRVNDKSVSNFNYNTYNYDVYLEKNITSVKVDVSKMLDSSTIFGDGNIDIINDNQKNQIIVTSESGKTRVYNINFIRETIDTTTVFDALNNSGFKYNDNYIFGINIGTNVSELIGNISNYNHTVEVKITDCDGNIKTNDSFRSGDIISITGNDGTREYTTLIYGDIDGDGLIDKKDLLSVQSQVFGYSNFSGVKKDSSDVDKNGVVDKKDLLMIQSHVFGYSKINQG